jgi:acyl carrier protein
MIIAAYKSSLGIIFSSSKCSSMTMEHQDYYRAMGTDEGNDVSKEAVLELVASQAGLSRADLPGERSLPDLGMSSFGVMRLVLALEEEFEMEFSGDQLKEFTTLPVSRLYELVEQARQPSSS